MPREGPASSRLMENASPLPSCAGEQFSGFSSPVKLRYEESAATGSTVSVGVETLTEMGYSKRLTNDVFREINERAKKIESQQPVKSSFGSLLTCDMNSPTKNSSARSSITKRYSIIHKKRFAKMPSIANNESPPSHTTHNHSHNHNHTRAVQIRENNTLDPHSTTRESSNIHNIHDSPVGKRLTGTTISSPTKRRRTGLDASPYKEIFEPDMHTDHTGMCIEETELSDSLRATGNRKDASVSRHGMDLFVNASRTDRVGNINVEHRSNVSAPSRLHKSPSKSRLPTINLCNSTYSNQKTHTAAGSAFQRTREIPASSISRSTSGYYGDRPTSNVFNSKPINTLDVKPDATPKGKIRNPPCLQHSASRIPQSTSMRSLSRSTSTQRLPSTAERGKVSLNDTTPIRRSVSTMGSLSVGALSGQRAGYKGQNSHTGFRSSRLETITSSPVRRSKTSGNLSLNQTAWRRE